MKKTLLTTAIVLLLVTVPVMAGEAEYRTQRVVLSNEGVYLEADNGPVVLYLGFNGVGAGYRQYVEPDTFVLLRGGLGNYGLNFGMFLGKGFVYEDRDLDVRAGMLFTGQGAKFAIGAGLSF